MKKSIKQEIELCYEENRIEDILRLLEEIPNWRKEEYGEYARALNNLERYEEAIAVLKERESKDKNDMWWTYRMMYSHFFLQHWEEVILLAQASFPYPKEIAIDVQNFVIDSYLVLGRETEALHFLEKHCEAEDADWNINYASVLARQDQSLAIPYFEKALLLLQAEGEQEDETEIAKMLAHCYLALEDREKYEEIKIKYQLRDEMISLHSYSPEEKRKVVEHIEKYFGKIVRRIPAFEPEYIDFDILVLAPSSRHPYTTLMTLGMGSRFMEGTPEELIMEGLGYHELFFCLPDDWEFNAENSWPIQYLMNLAKFPFINQAWLSAGHSLSYDEYIGNTNFTGFYITYPYSHDVGAFQLELSAQKSISFYNVIALYEEELLYKQEVGIEELEDLFEESPMVFQKDRKNVADNQEAEETMLQKGLEQIEESLKKLVEDGALLEEEPEFYQ